MNDGYRNNENFGCVSAIDVRNGSVLNINLGLSECGIQDGWIYGGTAGRMVELRAQ